VLPLVLLLLTTLCLPVSHVAHVSALDTNGFSIQDLLLSAGLVVLQGRR
jgi:hypothetical protein